jgi:hypothetical protein
MEASILEYFAYYIFIYFYIDKYDDFFKLIILIDLNMLIHIFINN